MSVLKILDELGFERDRMWKDTGNYHAVIFCKKEYFAAIVDYLEIWVHTEYDAYRRNITLEHEGVGKLRLVDPKDHYKDEVGKHIMAHNHAGMEYTTVIIDAASCSEWYGFDSDDNWCWHRDNMPYMMSRLRSPHEGYSRMVIC